MTLGLHAKKRGGEGMEGGKGAVFHFFHLFFLVSVSLTLGVFGHGQNALWPTLKQGTGEITTKTSELVNWCFEPSQPLAIISGLKETFIERHIVERTNKEEIRPEEQSEKTESYRENLWNEIQLKGP